jgi:hypothetical protein
MGFGIGLSHDGPGQHVRGPDPLADPDKRDAILDLYRRLAPQGRISFNAMVNRENTSRAAIQRFFIDLTGDPFVKIGEGGIVDAYDEGGVALSLGADEFSAYRNQAFGEIRSGAVANFDSVRGRILGFLDSLRTRRPSSALGQKCGMDRSDAIAVDLRGNVLTCQNVSAAATAPNGQRHRIPLGAHSRTPSARHRNAHHRQNAVYDAASGAEGNQADEGTRRHKVSDELYSLEWASPEIPDTFDRCDDDIGGVRWGAEGSMGMSSSARR